MSRTANGYKALYLLRIISSHIAAYISTAAIADYVCLRDSELVEEHGHVFSDHTAVPVQVIASRSSVSAEIREKASVLPRERQDLSCKSQQSPAEVAVKEQYCLSSAKFFVVYIQSVYICIRHVLFSFVTVLLCSRSELPYR